MSLGLLAPLLATPTASWGGACVPIPGLDDKCEAWVVDTGFGEICCDFVENPAARNIVATGSRLFYTLPVNDPGQPQFEERWDFETVAIDSSNGAQQWKKRNDGPAGKWDVPLSLEVSPDESTVYVTGYRDYPHTPNVVNPGCVYDYEPASAFTIAYDASSGAEVWRFGDEQRPATLDAALSSVLSPDGSILYTVGLIAIEEGTQGCDHDLGITAIEGASGSPLWSTTLAGNAQGWDAGYAAAVTPDGSALIVGGVTTRQGTGADFLTLALDAKDDEEDDHDRPGEILWQRSEVNAGVDALSAMALSSDGSRVFVSGNASQQGTTAIFGDAAYSTLAYDTRNGTRLWRSLYTGSTAGPDAVLGLAVSPQGDRVFVTGQVVVGAEVSWDYGTVAYNAATGGELWSTTYRDAATAFEEAADVLVSPDGTRVYVTGHSGHPTGQGDAATLAYSAINGTRLWVGRLNGSLVGADYTQGLKMAISPDGARLFAMGSTVAPVDDGTLVGEPGDASKGLVWSYDTSA